MILSKPEISVPLLLRFPYPAWATWRSEVGGQGIRSPGSRAGRDTGWSRRPAGCAYRDIREVWHRQKPSSSFTGCSLGTRKDVREASE